MTATKKRKRVGRLPETIVLEMLASRGFMAGKCETNEGRHVRRDLFGFLDLLAIHPALDRPTLGLQVTDITSTSKRVEKMLTDRADQVRNCLAAGWRIEVWAPRREMTRSGEMLKAVSFWLDDDRRALHTCEGSLTLLHLTEI